MSRRERLERALGRWSHETAYRPDPAPGQSWMAGAELLGIVASVACDGGPNPRVEFTNGRTSYKDTLLDLKRCYWCLFPGETVEDGLARVRAALDAERRQRLAIKTWQRAMRRYRRRARALNLSEDTVSMLEADAEDLDYNAPRLHGWFTKWAKQDREACAEDRRLWGCRQAAFLFELAAEAAKKLQQTLAVPA